MDREVAEVIHPVACGLDVHSAILVACLVRSGPSGGPRYEERSFPTALQGLRELRDWLFASGCQAVGMEATGVYWMPVFAALEGHVQMTVGNPNHMQNLRGHKTDRKDARWIAGLVRHDLIRPSFVPKQEFRDARELTRFRRQLIQARTSMRNEVQRLLARQGVTLGTVLSNVFGTSGMAILESLAEGRSVVDELPKLIHHSVKKKLGMLTAALEAPLFPVPRKLLALQLKRLEVVEENIQDVEGLIAAQMAPLAAAGVADEYSRHQPHIRVCDPCRDRCGHEHVAHRETPIRLGGRSTWVPREWRQKYARRRPKGEPVPLQRLDGMRHRRREGERLPPRGQIPPPLRPDWKQEEGTDGDR
ncbi:MAG: IS110 family transposase [Holophagaceae bacterium]|nr:IS110 family transposase [Holophagaceae bacterium]